LFNLLKIFLIGFFYLVILSSTTYSAQQITGEVSVKTTLRICADPNNLPYSNQNNEGYENKIADLFAKKLGNIPVIYSWYPMTSGFVRRTLDAKTCDLIVTFPAIHEFVQNSNPFYNSSYAFMSLEERNINIKTLSDPEIKEKKYKIGIIHATPPTSYIAKYKLFDQAKFYRQAADPRKQKPWIDATNDLVDGKIDIAILWGPLAGYEAKKAKKTITIVPLTKEETISRGKLVYRFTMGIRRNEPEWEKTINNLIKDNQEEINEILREYGIPLLDKLGNPLK
jgi:quinoprotein dehydrogenase-associated probable ABC transporter substrate-binding protein